MANKVYTVGLDDREFRRKLQALERESRAVEQRIQRNLQIHSGNNALIAPLAFRAPDVSKLRNAQLAYRGVSSEVNSASVSVIRMNQTVKDLIRGLHNATGSVGRFVGKWGEFLSLAGAAAFTRQIVSVRGEFQQLEIAFSTMLGSAEKAQTLISQLAKTAATTPFALTDVTQGAKQLLAYGVQADKINEKLLMLGDIASGLSLPLGDLIYLYGTTMTQGRVYTRDMIQFMGRGIPLAEELAKQFGVTKDKVSELVTAGKVGAKEFNMAMESMRANRFNNLMAEQSKSLTGQISNLQDSIEMMMNEIGKSTQGIASNAIQGVSWMVEHYKDLGRVIAGLVATYGTYRTALIANAAVETMKGHSISTLIRYIKMATKAQLSFNLAAKMNPYALAASALVGLISAVILFRDSASSAEKAQKNFNKALEDEKKALDERKQKGEEAIRVIKDENATRLEQHQAFKDLQALYPDLFQNMDIEKAKTLELTETIKKMNEAREEGLIKSKKARVEEAEANVRNAEKLVEDAKKGVGQEAIAAMQYAKQKQDIAREELRLARADLSKAENAMAESMLSPEQKRGREASMLRILKEQRDKILEEMKTDEGKLNPLLDLQLKQMNESIKKSTEALKSFDKVKTASINDEIKATTDRIKDLKKEIADLRKGKGETDGKSFADVIEAKEKELKGMEGKLSTLTGANKGSAGKSAGDLGTELAKYEKSIRDQAQKQSGILALEALDGFDRIEEEYNQTMKAIEGSKQEYMSKYKKTQEEANALFYDLEAQAKQKKVKEEEKYYKDLQDKHATYLQQRQKIEEQADKDAALFRSRGDEENAREVERKKKQDLEAIDLAFAMRSDEFESWVNKIADMSLSKLNEQLISAMSMLAAMELDPNGQDPQKLAELRAAIVKLQEQLRQKQSKGTNRTIKEWQDLHRTLSDVGNQFRTLGSDIGGTLGSVISETGEFAQATLSMVDGIITFADTGIKGIKDAVTATEVATKTLEASTVILSVIGAGVRVLQMISKWTARNNELTKEQTDAYRGLIENTNELVEANKRLMASLSGDELKRKYKETVDAIKESIKESRKFADEYLNSGGKSILWGAIKTKGSHGEELSRQLFDYSREISEILGREVKGVWTGSGFNKRPGLDLGWIRELNAEQILKLKEIPSVWSKFGKELQDILMNIVEADKQLKETAQSNLEAITGTTSEALKDDMANFLDDLSEGMEAPAKSFEQSMKNAMKRIVRNKIISGAMDEYYKKLAEYGEDGVYSEDEVKTLKEMYMAIVENAKKNYEAQSKVLGELPNTEDPRSAQAKGIATASQDSVDEYNGLMRTSVQIVDRIDKRFSSYADTVQDMQVKGWQDVRAIRELTEKIERSTLSIDTSVKDISINGLTMK